jgi:arylsulfatase A-like enzyme/Flp pilus assembly protein TadD
MSAMRTVVALARLLPLVLLSSLLSCGEGEQQPVESAAAVEPTAPATRIESLPEAPLQPVEDVLLITIDTLRADALGFMGNSSVSTPTLDQLSSGGWTFDNARAHNVVTLPSHTNILTGLHPYEHGIRDNTGFALPETVPTLATELGRAGFATAAFVAAFPLDARFGLDRGFDLYDDDYNEGSHPTEFFVPERSGDESVARAREWWGSQGERRRFLWLHFYEPHAPYEPPEPYASRHRDRPYYGEVEAVDGYLAPLLEPFLNGSERPAMIVVTSDHGEALGDHGEVTHGLFAYEPTIKAPLVIWGAGIGTGRTDFPARHVDLMPTVLTAAGVELPERVAGQPLFSGSASADVEQYFESLSSTFNQGFAPLRGLVRGDHKFISLPLPELYDLASDPDEAQNLVDTDRDRARLLARGVPTESVWPPRRGETSAEAEDALRSLGYLTGSATMKESYGPEDDPKTNAELDRKVHRVVLLYQGGRYVEAEALAREVLAQRRQMGLAWTYLAQVLLQQGKTEEAISVMREAEREGLARDSLLRQLGLSLAEVGRYPEALAVLERFGDSDDKDVLNALGLILSEAGRQGEARATLSRIIETDPRNPVAHQNLAVVALRSQDWSTARYHAERALEVNDGLGLAWNYLGTALYNLGDPRGALDAWDRAVAAEADSYDALYNSALVAGQIGDAVRARRALERFIATAPSDRYGPDIEQARAMLRQLPGG